MTTPNWGPSPQQYQQPAPYYPPQQDNSRSSSNGGVIVLTVIVGILAVALVGFLAYYFTAGSGGSSNSAKSSEIATVQPQQSDENTRQKEETVTRTLEVERDSRGGQAPRGNPSPSRSFTSFDRDSSTTSYGFAQNVFNAFCADYDAYGNANTTLYGVWSEARDRQYTMSCSDEGSRVVCRGGVGAAVYIW